MTAPVSFPYRHYPGRTPLLRPLIPMELSHSRARIQELALVDSGADVCMLPYHLGVQLGLDWNSLPALPPVGGALGSATGRATLIDVTISHFAPFTLSFNWDPRDDIPLILGQVNFFELFDVCFFRKRGVFQIQPSTP